VFTTTMEVVAVDERETIRRELVGLIERPPATIEPRRRRRRRVPSSEWWLTRASHGASCDGCSAWLREGAPLVFCAVGPRRFCRACARRRGIKWRVAESMRRDRRARKDERIAAIDAQTTAVLDVLRQRSGPVSVEELRNATGLGPDALAGVLSRLKVRGLAARRGDRGWVPARCADGGLEPRQ
jgi:DNA-binding transcriptional ArsR family regulator